MTPAPAPVIAALGWVGVVLGHLTAYLLTYATESVRHVHLERTGHGWLDAAVLSMVALVPVALTATTLRAMRGEAPRRAADLVRTLLWIQLPAFTLIEIAERGWSLAEAAADPAVLIGLLLQPVLALVAVLALRLLHRAVELMLTRPQLTSGRGAPPPRLRRAAGHRPDRPWLALRGRRRAPPLLLST